MTPRDALKAARLARGWTQRELGERVGLTHTTISRLESGDRIGALSTWKRLVAVLDLDANMVLASPEDAPTIIEDTECTP
jgi:transcriptional regulator with XRE-family HTH domain